jgi:ectoine hydroxylase-related dioxygenase (phytanoyl-CoA dioxygenase family)
MPENKFTRISEEKKKFFHEKGYAVFENVIPPDYLKLLRGECDRFIAETDMQLETGGIHSESISVMTRRNCHYHIPALEKSEKLRNFVFGNLTESFCYALLDGTAYLYYEAFNVKYPKVGLPVFWHQDTSTIRTNSESKVLMTLWCNLDAANSANGCLKILPYDRAGTREAQEHIAIDPSSPQKAGYFGDDPGDIIEVPAGSIVAMSGTTFHSSDSNVSERMRRAYLIIYSQKPIVDSNGIPNPKRYAEPFLKNGARVLPN